jgi:periplasmic divalent cation tolerance protein
MTDKILVLTATGSAEEAKKIARGLVERKLTACVNIVPRVTSIYRWQGAVEEAEEYLLIAKTDGEHFAQVRDAILDMHSYEVPECVAVEIEDGSAAYLSWIGESLKSDGRAG